MKCIHEGCNGTLVEKPDEKTGPNVFECDSCHCTYRLVNVRKESTCPSLKGVSVKKSTDSDAIGPVVLHDISVKRSRGRPKGSKNKK